MSNSVIKVDNLSKMYDLGLVGTGTLSKDLNRYWAKLRGHPDPYAKLAEINDRSKKSEGTSVWALRNLNFSVGQGDVLGIIGKNGAGKSTLLKLLSQITAPSKGEIKIRGRIASLLEVGTGMHPEMTARQNIYLNGAIMGMHRQEITSKLDEIVDFAGIGKYIDTPIKRFSSGMQVRLGFAVAAFLEPEILIVDEVLAVGDAEFQKKAIGKMQDVSKAEGRTVLFVSHNMTSVQSLCTKGMLLDKGYITFNGGVAECIEKYLHSDNLSNELDTSNRSSDGFLQICKLSLLDTQNKEIDVLLSGMSCKVRLWYKASISVEDAFFSIAWFSALGSFYTTCRSDMVSDLINVKEGEGFIDFIFNRLPFTAGSYNINLLAKGRNGGSDWIQNACTINVENGDFYNKGILPASGRQGIMLKFQIEL